MATIEKKAWPRFFRDLRSGTKRFDIRLGNLRVKPGDTLLLCEWDPKTERYTGRELRRKVTYILRTKGQKFWPKKLVERYGFIILSLR